MSNLKKIFKNINLFNERKVLWDQINSATTNLENSLENEIVFYRLFDNKESEENLRRRLLTSKAGLLILTRNPKVEIKLPVYVVSNEIFLEIQNTLLDIIYKLPKELKIIGITGTNGKTTTAWLGTQILKQWGIESVSIGTLGVRDEEGRTLENLSGTTPSIIDLRRIFHKYSKKNIFLIEVSSHSLIQKRLGDFILYKAGWTNFSQDHLDYHKTMKEYFLAKKKIIDYIKDIDKDFLIPYGEKNLTKKLKEEEIVFRESLSFEKIPKKLFNEIFLLEYNQKNLSLAYSLVYQLSDSFKEIDLSKILSPPGRFELIKMGTKNFVIDFAHTPDAIEKILTSIKHSFQEREVWIIFGCGGERDKLKRPLMGKKSEELADKVILTSDNPRNESSIDIIENIVEGFIGKPEAKIIDRKKAISYAYENSSENAMIVIAGKGDESYQEIKNIKYPFNDRLVVLELEK